MKHKKLQRVITVFLAVVCMFCFSAQGIFALNWVDFQGNPEHNGVVDVNLPTVAEDATLYWATKATNIIGIASAPSHPIIVDDVLVYFAGKKVYKADTVTGEILQEGTISGASTWNITAPTYADGVLYLSLANGVIQAIDFETLESLWIYRNGKSGQSNCPIVYHDGYVYTGYWNGPSKDADYVCVSAEDGSEVWTLTHTGGFYWAGCYVNDTYLLVGSDDGFGTAEGTGSSDEEQKETSVFYSVNAKTGEVIDKVENLNGDIRSTIAFADGTAYFATEGGSFYSVNVAEDGTVDKESLKEIDLGGKSTSTPVVYNDRAYVGVMSEKGQFEAYSGHYIAVLDLKNNSIAYTCPTQGFVQTSGLLTTAYEEEEGYIYVYFVDNYFPGKIRVIKDQPGQTEMISKGDYADILFTPASTQQEYSICGPVCDEYGTMYFKNDSYYMMALGPKIEKIEITKEPDKTVYLEGETFDPAGMVVTATYANGVTKDITKYMAFSEEALSLNDIDVTLSFDHVMYGDADDGKNDNDENKLNQTVYPLYVSVDITVEPNAVNDLIEAIDEMDGKITKERVDALMAEYNELTEEQQGRVTNYDKLASAAEKVESQPFTDVNSGDWFYPSVCFNYWNGLMNGMSEGIFAPNGTTTRAQLVLILYRFDGSPEVSGTMPFTDVTEDWYKNAVLWANQNGIVNGTSATTFAPDDPITREQLVTILYRYCGDYKDMNVSNIESISSYPDVSEVDKYAVKPFQWAVAQGYVSGTFDANGQLVLDPNGQA
ncbi:MAG: S-layer homology domain-containing protein, partial [Firmicutes bacterium]|nr:S-layer homology domain-containing protein [Bacillota bacterium]